MELLAGTDSCLTGRPVEEVVRHELRTLNGPGMTLRLSGHGLSRLADCVRFGRRAQCRYALGFRPVLGNSRCTPAHSVQHTAHGSP
jgi:hypothetical protein